MLLLGARLQLRLQLLDHHRVRLARLLERLPPLGRLLLRRGALRLLEGLGELMQLALAVGERLLLRPEELLPALLLAGAPLVRRKRRGHLLLQRLLRQRAQVGELALLPCGKLAEALELALVVGHPVAQVVRCRF